MNLNREYCMLNLNVLFVFGLLYKVYEFLILYKYIMYDSDYLLIYLYKNLWIKKKILW